MGSISRLSALRRLAEEGVLDVGILKRVSVPCVPCWAMSVSILSGPQEDTSAKAIYSSCNNSDRFLKLVAVFSSHCFFPRAPVCSKF